MTRTVTVTGGFSGSVVADFTDSLSGLASVTFRMALCPVGQEDPPPVDSPTWKDAEGAQTTNTAAMSIPVDGTQPLGQFNVAYDVVSGGRHEAGWVADRTNSGARALVIVT